MIVGRYFVALVMTLAAVPADAKALVVDGVRSPYQSNQLRVILSMNDKPRFTWSYNRRQQRLRLNIKSAILAPDLTLSVVDNPIMAAAPSVQAKKKSLSISFDLFRRVRPKVFYLPPTGAYAHRLVLDFKPTKANLSGRLPGKSPHQTVIVLDPGHGGSDPGALGVPGAHNYPEKRVVLDIAIRLKKALSQRPNLKVILTRTRDVYVGLPARVSRARDARADFFISIHADANTDPSAKGASVFVRPDKIEANTETLNWLVNQEGHGIPDDAADARGVETLHNNLIVHASLATTLKLAGAILGQLKQVTKLHGDDIKRGNFEVIRVLGIPSVLIETGFISNPEEGRQLRSVEYRQMLAHHLALVLIDFIREQRNSPGGWISLPLPEQTPLLKNKTPAP